jgi:hypothetical protein
MSIKSQPKNTTYRDTFFALSRRHTRRRALRYASYVLLYSGSITFIVLVACICLFK